MSDLDELKAVVSLSAELSQRGQHREALRIIDESIAGAAPQNRSRWTKILSQHGAAISRSARDDKSIRRYCEQIILCDPEDATARYILADLFLRQGRADLAKQQAVMSYIAAQKSNTQEGKGVVELILRTWPDVAGEAG